MKEDLDRIRLSDRIGAILRTDRSALRQSRRNPSERSVLLVLVPDSGTAKELFDAYLPDLATGAGLRYVRLAAADRVEIAPQLLDQSLLVLADLAGRHERVITLVYQTFGHGRRVLLAAREPGEIPPDLDEVPAVFYGTADGEFDALLDAVRQMASPTGTLSTGGRFLQKR